MPAGRFTGGGMVFAARKDTIFGQCRHWPPRFGPLHMDQPRLLLGQRAALTDIRQTRRQRFRSGPHARRTDPMVSEPFNTHFNRLKRYAMVVHGDHRRRSVA